MGPNPLREPYHRLLTHGRKPNLAKLTIGRQIAAMVFEAQMEAWFTVGW